MKTIIKNICFVLMVTLISCSEAPDDKVETPLETKSAAETDKNHTILKGHQDVIQRAKDMEKEVLKAAEKQKKTIDDLDG